MLEIEKLDKMLTEAGIQHTYIAKGKIWRTLWVPGDKPELETQRYSMIQHSCGIYGCERGLIELWDLREERPDETLHKADECFDIITGKGAKT